MPTRCALRKGRCILLHRQLPGATLVFHAMLTTLLLACFCLCLPCRAAVAASATDTVAPSPTSDPTTGSPAVSDNTANNASPLDKDADSSASEDALPLNDETWEAAWSGQTAHLDEISAKVEVMSTALSQKNANLGERLQRFTEEARKLMVLATTYKDWPNPMEAVNRRITVNIQNIRKTLEPGTQARKEAAALLERVSYMADSLPDDLGDTSESTEMQDFVRKLTHTRLRLIAVQTQFDLELAPFLYLIGRLQKLQADIGEQLPLLWKNYYLQKPLSWLSPDTWKDFTRRIQISVQGMQLRLPVELPVTPQDWVMLLLRFCFALLVTGVLTYLLHRRLAEQQEANPTVRHICRVSLPWLCVGLALLGSSIAATGEVFRLFLALGNLCLIVAQIFLAWDLRLLKYPDTPPQASPFVTLIQPTLCSYVLLYLPLTQALVLVLWLGIVVLSIVRQHRRPALDLGPMHVETSVLVCEPVLLWLCLLLTLGGMHIYSMVLYLLFVSCSLALQLCVGGMALFSRLNDSTPQEGARAVLAHLGIALAAPLVLVAAVLGVSQWVGTLPGGMYLLQYYVFRSVNVGATQFSILHLLLIITLFYLTRTAVAMGSRFLARLPQQGFGIDTTLIPPIQTAFTYILWCCFGLFTLRALGVELSNLAMVAGGLSVGIGFGMQNIVNNFLSGLILIFSRTLQAGDVVEVGGTQGRVRKISVRATMVETFDNALIIVPNAEFISNRLINWTRNSRTVRREIAVGVAYGTDVSKVMQVLRTVANAHANVLKYPQPTALFNGFGDSTLDFLLRFWVRDYDVAVGTASDLRQAIEKEFREQHIEVAFPQLDVHIKDVPGKPIPVLSRTPPQPNRTLRSLRKLHPAGRSRAVKPAPGVPNPS